MPQNSILQRSLGWCCNCFTGGSACNANPEHSVTIQLQHGYVSASGTDTHMPFSCSLCPWGALEGTFKCRCPDVNIHAHTYTHRCIYRLLVEHPHFNGLGDWSFRLLTRKAAHLFLLPGADFCLSLDDIPVHISLARLTHSCPRTPFYKGVWDGVVIVSLEALLAMLILNTQSQFNYNMVT